MEVLDDSIEIITDKSDDTYLQTQGLTTCLAILLKGSCNGISFIIMHHWNAELGSDRQGMLQAIIGRYFAMIQDETIEDFDPDLDEEIEIFIDKVAVIGGEKKQFTRKGLLSVSGTESTVNYLVENLNDTLKMYYTIKSDANWVWKNYLTKGEQSLTVTFHLSGKTSYKIIEPVEETYTQASKHQRRY